MTTPIRNPRRVRQEFLSDVYPLPGGRLVIAELETNPGTFAGPAPAERPAVQLIAEVRDKPEGHFVAVAKSEPLNSAGRVRLTIPTPREQVPYGERPPMLRLRLVGTGEHLPRYDLRLIGL